MDINLLLNLISAIGCSICLLYVIRTQIRIWDIDKEIKRLQVLEKERIEKIQPITEFKSISKLAIPKKFLQDLLKGKVIQISHKESALPIDIKFKKMDFDYVTNVVEAIKKRRRKIKIEFENERK